MDIHDLDPSWLESFLSQVSKKPGGVRAGVERGNISRVSLRLGLQEQARARP